MSPQPRAALHMPPTAAGEYLDALAVQVLIMAHDARYAPWLFKLFKGMNEISGSRYMNKVITCFSQSNLAIKVVLSILWSAAAFSAMSATKNSSTEISSDVQQWAATAACEISIDAKNHSSADIKNVCGAIARVVSGDVEEGFSALKDFADGGNVIAIRELGLMYLTGEYSQYSDEDIGASLIRKAAIEGDANAQLALGNLLIRGTIYSQDRYEEAIYWLDLASTRLPKANVLLGDLYRRGVGVDSDNQIAFEYYLRGAALGNENARAWTGTYYALGFGVEPNQERARYWFTREVDSFFPTLPARGRIVYGMQLVHGLGGEKDVQKGITQLVEALSSKERLEPKIRSIGEEALDIALKNSSVLRVSVDAAKIYSEPSSTFPPFSTIRNNERVYLTDTLGAWAKLYIPSIGRLYWTPSKNLEPRPKTDKRFLKILRKATEEMKRQ